MENEWLASLRRAQELTKQNGTSITIKTLEDYDLGGVNCKECNNTGTILKTLEDGQIVARECACMNMRRSLRRIKKSGLADVMDRYTFDAYETPTADRANIKRKAIDFCRQNQGWFYISGRSGSGKSHICVAICSELINMGNDVRFMSWRDESTAIKAAITDAQAYEEAVRKLKTVKVLYIDDFFKGGCTQADIRLAFEILNARYLDSKLRTIISSEMEMPELLSNDEALGGRVYERSRGFVLKAPNENWRLR